MLAEYGADKVKCGNFIAMNIESQISQSHLVYKCNFTHSLQNWCLATQVDCKVNDVSIIF